jgi:uncharacterized lipoprotein YmbA
MTSFRWVRRAAVLCMALTVASCASTDPKLYTIAPVQGAAVSGAPKVIALHSVGIARYLQRNQIVRSSDDYRLDVMSNDWWGEPLDAMVARVLTEELSQRLPKSTVYRSSGAVTGSPEATVELEIERFDVGRDGSLLLVAQASVAFKNRANPDTRSFRFAEPLPSTGAQGQVAAASAALGQVADRVAAMLVAQPRRN